MHTKIILQGCGKSLEEIKEHQNNENIFLSYIKEKGLAQAVYNYFYFIGCWLIRYFRLKKRHIILFWKINKIIFLKFINRIFRKLKLFLYEQYKRLSAPIQSLNFEIHHLKRLSALNKDNAKLNSEIKRKLISSISRNIGFYISKIGSYILPIIALILSINMINHYMDINYILEVEYNGEHIGYIEKESDFYEAEKMMMGRLTHEAYIKPTDAVPRFTLVPGNEDMITTKDTLTNLIISASGNQVMDADGLYIDNRFIGSFESADNILNFLNNTLEGAKTGGENESVSFVQKIEIKNGLYPVTSLADEEKVFEKLSSLEEKEKIYIVEKGDVPGTIAEKFGMPYSKLKQLNPNIEKKLLVGQEVLISAAVPYLGIKQTVTETYEEEIPYKVEKTINKNYNIGYSKTTQEGKNGVKQIVAKKTYVDGFETEKNILSTTVIKEPVNEEIVIGGKYVNNVPQGNKGGNAPASSVSTPGFMWPTRGGYVSCGIWGYPGHTGMDIAVPSGTPIYASASGTVVLAKNGVYGYGRHIMIDHGGGIKTLYAHNSQLLVSAGQWVEKGQIIAYSGNTGNSYGPHVHVEFRVNGQYIDPGKYIGYHP